MSISLYILWDDLSSSFPLIACVHNLSWIFQRFSIFISLSFIIELFFFPFHSIEAYDKRLMYSIIDYPPPLSLSPYISIWFIKYIPLSYYVSDVYLSVNPRLSLSLSLSHSLKYLFLWRVMGSLSCFFFPQNQNWMIHYSSEMMRAFVLFYWYYRE